MRETQTQTYADAFLTLMLCLGRATMVLPLLRKVTAAESGSGRRALSVKRSVTETCRVCSGACIRTGVKVSVPMPFAIKLRLDQVSGSRVTPLWRILAEAGVDSHCQDLRYGPHVTLALYRDDAPANLLTAMLDAATRQWRALPVTLSGIGVFPGIVSVVWAAPVVTQALLACHAALHGAIMDLATDPHYLPGAWLPHVTLSGGIADPERALAVLRPAWRPVTGMLVQADLVRLPINILRSHLLAT